MPQDEEIQRLTDLVVSLERKNSCLQQHSDESPRHQFENAALLEELKSVSKSCEQFETEHVELETRYNQVRTQLQSQREVEKDLRLQLEEKRTNEAELRKE